MSFVRNKLDLKVVFLKKKSNLAQKNTNAAWVEIFWLDWDGMEVGKEIEFWACVSGIAWAWFTAGREKEKLRVITFWGVIKLCVWKMNPSVLFKQSVAFSVNVCVLINSWSGMALQTENVHLSAASTFLEVETPVTFSMPSKKLWSETVSKTWKYINVIQLAVQCPLSMSQYGLTKEKERQDEVDLKQSRYILALQQFSGGGVTQFQNSSKDGKHMASLTLRTIGTSSHFCGLSNWVVSGLSHLAVLLTARFARLVHRTGPVTVKQNWVDSRFWWLMAAWLGDRKFFLEASTGALYLAESMK